MHDIHNEAPLHGNKGRKSQEEQTKPSFNIQYYDLEQAGPTSFFPLAKKSFPVGPSDQEIPPGTIFF
jgi:hypothetical protein